MTDAGTRRSTIGLLAAAGAFLLPVAYSPSVYAPFWSPKAAVLLVIGGAGLALLHRLWRVGPHRLPAAAATAFLGLATLSTVVSPAPLNALTGLYNWGTGFLFWAAVVGCWSLGVQVPEEERPLVLRALLAGIAVSGAVAVLQVLVSLGVPSLDQSGRAAGLAGNPVHLGALAAGAAAVAAGLGGRSLGWAAALALSAAVVQLSGTRFALAVLLGVAAVAVARNLRRDLVAAAAVGLATVAGLGLGVGIGAAGDVTTAVSRASEGSTSVVSSSGYRVRLEVWTYARHAIAERPVLGHGPGRFRAATSADRTLEVARYEGGDVIYTDAHNLVVEHAVTTGLLATLALLVWILLSARTAHGPLLWFALAVLAMALVQPSSVQTTPLLFLALGLAMPAVSPPGPSLALAPGLLAGLALAGVLLVGDWRLEQARLDFDLAHARGANTLLRLFPEPATMLARAHAFLSLSRESTEAESIRWRTEAVRRDRSDPALRVLLGDDLWAAGRTVQAEQQYQAALHHNSWSVAALSRMARLTLDEGDPQRARQFLERAISIRPDRSLERRLRALG